MEELHTDSIDGGHEGQLWARSRARERAYSNINLTRAKRAVPRYKNYDQERRYTYKRPYLYITVITQRSLRIIS
jgi:hypothetical protein